MFSGFEEAGGGEEYTGFSNLSGIILHVVEAMGIGPGAREVTAAATTEAGGAGGTGGGGGEVCGGPWAAKASMWNLEKSSETCYMGSPRSDVGPIWTMLVGGV